jgi:hypothetical protein
MIDVTWALFASELKDFFIIDVTFDLFARDHAFTIIDT